MKQAQALRQGPSPKMTTHKGNNGGSDALFTETSIDRVHTNQTVRSLVIFEAPLTKSLALERRLPPTYVGVRRVRPSCTEARSPILGTTAEERLERSKALVFTIKDENGNERRMTRQEKKERRLQLRNEMRASKKRKAEEAVLEEEEEKQKQTKTKESNECNVSGGGARNEAPINEKDGMVMEEMETTEQANTSTSIIHNDQPNTVTTTMPAPTNSKYHNLDINQSSLEEELADLRGERIGVPPVGLPEALGLQLDKTLADGSTAVSATSQGVQLDDVLSKEWADTLTDSMKDAIAVREKEDLRPMAYKIVPEVWKRLRPTFLSLHDDNGENGNDNAKKESRETNTNTNTTGARSGNNKNTTINGVDSLGIKMAPVPTTTERLWLHIRPQTTKHLDGNKAIVVDILHNQTNTHVSCGAKFGCDYLLYDGPRSERHAFAGMRVVEDGVDDIPTAYNIAGYVRCLNTAGKLALLAKVVRNHVTKAVSVVIVDLALEKILTAPTHTKRSRREARKKVGQNLAKASG